jgi:hypothetical protein
MRRFRAESGLQGLLRIDRRNIVSDGKRKVFKFSLKPVAKKSFSRVVDLSHNRLIPTAVKVEVWRRDGGWHMRFEEKSALRSRHLLSKAKQSDGSECSIAVRKHNLEKSDKILTIAPWILAGPQIIPHIHKFRA